MSEKPTEWCIVELMGRKTLAGHITEIESFGVRLMRVDIPRQDGSFITQFYSGAAVYSVTPTTEAVARAVAAANVVEPVHRFDLLPPEPAAPRHKLGSAGPVDDPTEGDFDAIEFDDLDPQLAFAPNGQPNPKDVQA